jgi:hypothetical protein
MSDVATFWISGSYKLPPPPPAPTRIDDGVREFFEKLGYTVTCDFSRRLHQSWWELYEDGIFVCQVDQSVPLEAIVQDFCQLHLKQNPNSNVNYCFYIPDKPRSINLLKKVYEFKTYNMMPNGQILLAL